MTYFIRSSPWAQKCWLDDSPFENVHTVNIDFLSLSIVHAGVYSTVYGEYILLVLSKLNVRRIKSRLKIGIRRRHCFLFICGVFCRIINRCGELSLVR